MYPDGTEDAGGVGADTTETDLQELVGQPQGTGNGQQQAPSEQALTGSQAFKFAGREWKGGQAEAEKAHNSLYGKYSESQGMLKHFKGALNNPAILAELSKDPQNLPILAKLGLQAAREEEQPAAQGGEQLPAWAQQMQQEQQAREAFYDLREEMKDFHESLGRKLSKEERDAVLGVLQDAPGLKVDQAYQVAFGKRDADAAIKKAQEAAAKQGRTQRPSPGPVVLPGTKMDLTKSVAKRNPDEWREGLRADPAFQKLVEG